MLSAAMIRHKQIARAVKGQSFRMIQPGGKGALRSARRELIDVAAVEIRHKQIARAVKGQSMRTFKPEAKVLSSPPGVNS